MLKSLIIEKKQLARFIDELISKYKVIAPTDEDGLIRFGEIKSSNQINLNSQSKMSSKEVLFPRCEILFKYELAEKDVKLEELQVKDKRVVLLGPPPCEARGLGLIYKALSSGEFQDKYFLSRRENTIIIGKSCEHPRSTCFCTSVGGSPFGKEGLDLLLQDLGNRYLLEAVSEKGERMVDELKGYKKATQADLDEAQRIAEAAEKSIKTTLELEDIKKKLDKMFDDPLWDVIYQKCIGCGVCTYLCPTCYCFDVLDESAGIKGKRVRIWDSCQFPLFTLQGSGENPRPTGKERMRQRIMHKFNYYPGDYGEFACTGCGRCVRECSVNLDIREILKMIIAN